MLSYNFRKILKNVFFIEHLHWLLLTCERLLPIFITEYFRYFLVSAGVSQTKLFKDIVRSFSMFQENQNSLENTFLTIEGMIYRLITYKILYLAIYIVFKRSLSICHVIQRHFQLVSIDFGFHFQNQNCFPKYFGFYLLTTVYIKKRY